MRAVTYTQYGSPEVLRLVELPKPAPKDNEVLVKVRTTTVTIGDVIMRSFNLPVPNWQKIPARIYLGIRKPKRPVLGMELAGDIEAVGKKVTRFKVGDAVVGSTFSVDFGGYAEYKCFPQDGMLILKPEMLSYEEAAALPGGGMTALHCLQQGQLEPGQHVLIYGASGAVGTAAVQLARNHFGAIVTGVCSGRNADLVRSLGADTVIDYTQTDFTETDSAYDLVFDAVGKLTPAQWKRARAQANICLNVHKDSGNGERPTDLQALKGLVDAGKYTPVVDRYYPLEEIVEAHRYVETGRKRGNVVIKVS